MTGAPHPLRDGRRRPTRRPAAALSLIALVVSGPAWAKAVAITCQDGFASSGAKMHIAYDGDAKGTLHVTAGLGDFTVPATLYTADDNSGVETIRGTATVSIKAPPMATMEACEAKRPFPSPNEGGTLLILPGDECLDGLKTASATIPMKADLAVVLLPPDQAGGAPEADLDVMKLVYPEKSATLGASLEITLVPPPQCAVDRP